MSPGAGRLRRSWCHVWWLKHSPDDRLSWTWQRRWIVVDSNSLVSRIPTTIPHLHRNSVGAVVLPYGVICTSAEHTFALEMMRSECFRLKTYFLLFIIPSNSILLLQIIDLFFASLRWFFSCLLLKFSLFIFEHIAKECRVVVVHWQLASRSWRRHAPASSCVYLTSHKSVENSINFVQYHLPMTTSLWFSLCYTLR